MRTIRERSIGCALLCDWAVKNRILTVEQAFKFQEWLNHEVQSGRYYDDAFREKVMLKVAELKGLKL